MKSRLIGIVFAFAKTAAILVVVAEFSIAVVCSVVFFARGDHGRPGGGGDFTQRYWGTRCAFEGVDPHDIVIGKVSHPVYVFWGNWEKQGDKKPLMEYPPYAYSFLLPICLLPKFPAALLYILLEAVSLAYIFRTAHKWAIKSGDTVFERQLITYSPLLLVYQIASAVKTGNFGLIFAALVLLMVDSLERRKPVRAAFCWAFVMMKPQIGLLFAIPLVVNRQWRTVVSAAALCCIASIPPAIACRKSPVEMVLEVLDKTDFDIYYTDLFPPPLLHRVLSVVPRPAFFIGLALVCICLCFVFSSALRSTRPWLLRFQPAILFAGLWTFCWPHDLCIHSGLTIMLAALACASSEKIVSRTAVALLALSCSGLLLVGSTSQGMSFAIVAKQFVHLGIISGKPIPLWSIYAVMSHVRFLLWVFFFTIVAGKIRFSASEGRDFAPALGKTGPTTIGV